MPNYSNSHTDLSELGYVTIPVFQDGKPVIKGFLEKEEPYSLKQITDWCERFPDTSVALVCGKSHVCALDFDVDDETVSKALVKYMKSKYPSVAFRTVQRRDNNHRFAVIFKAHPSMYDYANGSSAVFYYSDAVTNQIEYIGNKLITILGAHRKSGSYYQWDYPLCKTKIDDLPVISKRDIDDMFEKFKQLMLGLKYDARNSKATFSLRDNKKGLAEGFLTTRSIRVYSDEEVNELLSLYSGDTRTDWLRMGMAIHANYTGSDKGFKLWHEWSSEFNGYEGIEDCRTTWDSFKIRDGGLTLGAIKYELGNLSQSSYQSNDDDIEKKIESDDPLEQAIANLVYISEPDEIGDLSKTVPESVLSMRSARNTFRNQKIVVPTETPKGLVMKPIKVLDAFLDHPDRKTAHSKEYIPLPKRLVSGADLGDRGKKMQYYNTYIPPVVKPTKKTDLLHIFTEHVEYMFEDDPDWVYTWLAQIIQNPLKRHRTALYSIAPNTGTGRGWLVELMHHLYGRSNVNTVSSMDKLADPKAKTGFLEGAVMLIINETDTEGRTKYKVGDKLKSILSDDFQEVDVKWGKQTFNQRIYVRTFMQSNAIGNLVIEPNDNRVQVFLNMKIAREPQYYKRLYGALKKTEFINQVYSFLKSYPVDESKLQTASMTEAKKIVINANTTATASAFYEFISVVGGRCFTRNDLTRCVSMGMPVDDNVNERELRHLINDHIPFKRNIAIKNIKQLIMSTDLMNHHDMKPKQLWIEREKTLKELGDYYESFKSF